MSGRPHRRHVFEPPTFRWAIEGICARHSRSSVKTACWRRDAGQIRDAPQIPGTASARCEMRLIGWLSWCDGRECRANPAGVLSECYGRRPRNFLEQMIDYRYFCCATGRGATSTAPLSRFVLATPPSVGDRRRRHRCPRRACVDRRGQLGRRLRGRIIFGARRRW